MSESIALAKVGDKEYMLLKIPPKELIDLLQDNIGSTIKPTDLDRIKAPAGGSTKFEVPTTSGETETVSSIEGIILHQMVQRAYWNKAFGEGTNQPPDCISTDGIRGIGTPGGLCARCPNAEWGSKQDKEGIVTKAQACKETRLLFIIRPNEILPIVLVVPPTSLSNISKHLLRLASKGLPYWKCVHRFKLEPAQNANYKFAKIVPSLVGVLTDEQAQHIKTIADKIKPKLEQFVVAQEDTIDIDADTSQTTPF